MPAEQEQLNNVQLMGYVKGNPTANNSGTIATATLSCYNGKDRDGKKNKPLYVKVKGFGAATASKVLALCDGDKVQIHKASMSMDYWQDKEGSPRREIVLKVWELEVLDHANGIEPGPAPFTEDDYF